MKKENCPFCGHRWIRKSCESMIECPNCKTQYFIESKQDDGADMDIGEDEETFADELEEKTL